MENKSEQEDNADDDDDETPGPVPTYSEVLNSITTIKQYVQSHLNAENEMSLIYSLEDKLEEIKQRNMVQRKITDFA